MSNPTELPDLLPCPFCGNKAELHEEFRSAGHRAIECAECGANVGAVDLERGIEMWNRRAQPEVEAPQAVARLLQAAKVYAFNYMQDEADSEDGCVCGPKQHAEAKEVFAAIRAVESQPAATLSPLCGAQHAESGKEVADEKALFASAFREYDRRADDGVVGLRWDRAEGHVWRAARALAAQSQGAQALTPLDYRAQGREEALAVILGQSAEDPFADCIGWGKSGAPEDEGESYWDEDKLRALLHIGDKKHDAYDRAEAAYWDALGQKDETKREMLLVEQAPFYKPLIDFLAKHEAWGLMFDLKRAQQAAAPGKVADAEEAAKLQTLLMTEFSCYRVSGGGLFAWAMNALLDNSPHRAPSAPGTPEAPTDQDAKDAARYRKIKADNSRSKDETFCLFFDVDGNLLPVSSKDMDDDIDRAAQLDGGQEDDAERARAALKAMPIERVAGMVRGLDGGQEGSAACE